MIKILIIGLNIIATFFIAVTTVLIVLITGNIKVAKHIDKSINILWDEKK